MIVRCTNCDAAFSVDDQKVRNRRFAFTCPKCETHNVIDNRKAEMGLGVQPELADKSLMDEQLSLEETDKGVGVLTETSTEIPSFEDEVIISRDEPEIGTEEDFSSIESELSGLEESIKEESLDLEGAGVPDTGSDEVIDGVDVDKSIEKKGTDINLDDVIIYESSGETDLAIDGIELKADLIRDTDQAEAGIEDLDLDLDTIMPSEEEDAKMPEADFEAEPLDIGESGIDVKADESVEDISLDDALDNIDVSALKETEGVEFGEEIGGVGISAEEFDDFKPIEEDMSTETVESTAAEGIGPEGEELFEDEIVEQESDLQKDGIKTEEIFPADSGGVDESITIDLDSLDIQLDEEGPKPGAVEHEVNGVAEMSDLELAEVTMEEAPSADEGEDESITIDLDSLDIPLEEEEELKEGEVLGDDERLTLEDAGLTMDELVSAGIDDKIEEEEGLEEDIRISIDDIDPELSVDKLIKGVEEVKSALSDEIGREEVPEAGIEEFTGEAYKAKEPISVTERVETKDYLDIEGRDDVSRYRERIEEGGVAPSDLVPGGLINFSIDYSLKFSRVGAILRLLGLFLIRLLPNFVVAFVYCILSMILGALNWVVITFTGESVEDFTEIQEKTIRYILSLNACLTNVIEDVPKYRGEKDIDYSLQFDVTYPIRYSRILAFLRLTGIGILILALPHIVILALLTIGGILIYFVGIVSVIATRRWPTILFDFMIRYYRYTANVLSYIFGVIDKYPTFRFE